VTAAILVDDAIVKTVQKGKTTYTRRKRTPQELNQIKSLAEAVIGFDDKRGDTISIQNLSFDEDDAELDVPSAGWPTQIQKTVTQYSPVLRPVSLLMLFVLAYMFLIRPVQKVAMAPAPAGAGAEPLLPPTPHVESLPLMGKETPESSMRTSKLKEQAAELIRQKPTETARAVQAWLHEEPS
jgi:flagellar M-ring protein FliF